MRILVISGSPCGISRIEGHENGILHAPRFMEHAETYLKDVQEFGRSFVGVRDC